MAGQFDLDLPCGTKMPVIGIGTWQTTDDEEAKTSVKSALENGYRLIDTAYSYDNEKLIGQVLSERMKTGELKREKIFITSKLPGQHMGSRERVRKCLESSLKSLGVSYLDLWLIHFPVTTKANEADVFFPVNENGELDSEDVDLVEVWKHMEELVDEGKIKAIGLSNFNSKQIQAIHEKARHPISNLQVECHALLAQKELFAFCKERKITMTSYASLGSPGRPSIMQDEKVSNLLSNELIVSMAKKYGKTPAQVLLRNLVQRGIAVIPKSVKPNRIKENIQIFDFNLTNDEMEAISKLDCRARGFNADFNIKGMMEHPQYPFHIPY